MENRYALILTGEVLPGFAPGSVWARLAAYVHMEPARLAQLLARAPLIIRQDDNLGQLTAWQAGIAETGAQSEICPPDERPALFVQIGGTARGPIPRLMVEQRVRQGLWADSIQVAQAGATEWQQYTGLDAAAPAPAAPSIQTAEPPRALSPQAQPVPVEAPRSVWAAPESMRNLSAMPQQQLGSGNELPPGEAIHAGFWRRGAALTLDFFIIIVPLLICNTIPLIGSLIGMVGQWLYFALMDSSEYQATPGKRAMGLKVVDKYGRRLGFGRATWRHFSEVLPIFVSTMMIGVPVMMMNRAGNRNPFVLGTAGIIFGVVYIAWLAGYLMAGWTRRKQSLYDMMAGTLIVFRKVEPGQPFPEQRPPMPWYGWVLNIAPSMLGFLVGILAVVGAAALRH